MKIDSGEMRSIQSQITAMRIEKWVDQTSLDRINVKIPTELKLIPDDTMKEQ